MMKKKITFLGGVIAVMLLSLPTWAYVQTQQRAGDVDEPVTAPYTADFSQEDTFDKCIVIDANEDENTWFWSSNACYKYHSSNNANDYLILPIELEANKNYNVIVSAKQESLNFPEKFEVKVGKVATPEELNITAIPEEVLRYAEGFVDIEGSFTTDEAGTWYVAIHATSDADMNRLWVKSLTVELGAASTAPVAIEDLTATAGEEGALEVNLAFTAPQKAIDGTDLAGKESIKVYRDDVLVHTITGVEPGSQQTWKDTDVEDGQTYAYHVVAANEIGDGVKSEKVSVYVGQDTPTDVENVKISATTATTVTLTWDPVSSVGATGGYVNPEKVKYSVVEFGVYWNGTLYEETSKEPLTTVTGATTATFDYPVEGEEQAIKYFGVKAVAGSGNSDPLHSVVDLFVGAPYELPMEETFTGSEPTYFWHASSETDCSYSNGALQFSLKYGASSNIASVESGKLNLKETINPTLKFDAMTENYYVDEIVVYGIAPDGTTSDIATFAMTDDYQTFTAPIPESLKNKDWARIGFKVDYDGGWDPICLDNIKVFDLLDNDLSIAVSAPASVEAGSKAVVTATVKNEGAQPVPGSDYTVIIKAGDEELLHETGRSQIDPTGYVIFTSEIKTSIFDNPADIAITATVVFEADEKASNNTAETIIAIVEPTVSGVTDVVAVEAGNGIEVSWTAPELVADVKEVTEDFENGEGDWTFIDVDEDGETWTWSEWSAHSGSGCLSSYSWTAQPSTVDNWLVSPEIVLDGTFKFWAKPGDESFQVYVSTESATDISTFDPVSEKFYGNWNFEYEEYEVDLSAYAGETGWIAIRHFDSYWDNLYIDDITYLVSDGIVEIEKYNIYMDGELAATADADQTTVTIEDVKDGSHTVAVSVVYVNGKESKPVETTVEIATGLNKITVVTKPVDVYSLDGKLVRKQATSLSGLKGIYIMDGKKVVLK